jgi:hypothetical protein
MEARATTQSNTVHFAEGNSMGIMHDQAIAEIRVALEVPKEIRIGQHIVNTFWPPGHPERGATTQEMFFISDDKLIRRFYDQDNLD